MMNAKTRLATINDVARTAGVSVSTVSAVMNGTKRVSPALQKRVHAAIDQLDFHPNKTARNLGKGKSRTVAYVVPDTANVGFLEIFKTLNRIARARNYTLVFVSTEGRIELAEEAMREIFEMRVAGVFLTLSWENVQTDARLAQLREFDINVVGLSGPWPIENVDCFLQDEVGAGRRVGAYLRRLGHSRIHCVGPRDSKTAELRWSGILSIFKETGTDSEITFGESHGYSAKDGYNAMSKSIEFNSSWTATVAFNDVIATGMLASLYDNNIQVPEHISFISFGSSLVDYRRPTITSVRFDTERMTQRAAERLFDLIENKGDATAQHDYTESEIIVRGSTKILNP